VVVGVPVNNRRYAEIEHLIGYFVNTLVLRAHVSDRITFRAFLQQVSEVVVNALTHQDLPFENG